jgi:putative transposase
MARHLEDKGDNNRVENSHQPTSERERRMRGFKSGGQAQWLLSTFGTILSVFTRAIQLLAAKSYRAIMRGRFAC